MSETYYVTTRGPRLTYVRKGRTKIETFAVVAGGMATWRENDGIRASCALSTSATKLRQRSESRTAYRSRRKHERANERKNRDKTQVMQPMRGAFKLLSVINAEGAGSLRVTAVCTDQYCAEAPTVVHMSAWEWNGPASKGRHRCRTCASQMRAAIQRAISVRSRGNVPAVIEA